MNELALAEAAGGAGPSPAGTVDEVGSAQILHVGRYTDEPATIPALHDVIRANGLALRGRYHEIDLGDPGDRTPSARTILRQPGALRSV
jgi:hypothetical protein